MKFRYLALLLLFWAGIASAQSSITDNFPGTTLNSGATVLAGSVIISNGTASTSASNDTIVRYGFGSYASLQACITISQTNYNDGAQIYLIDPSINGYNAYVSSNVVYIQRRVAGVATNLTELINTFNAGTYCLLYYQGQLTLSNDGSIITQLTDSSPYAATSLGPGFGFYSPGSALSQFTAAGSATPTPQAPVITSQPANVATRYNTQATFTVAAYGIPVPAVQWHVIPPGGSDTVISGATSLSYTATNVQAAQSGSLYYAALSNTAGTLNSSQATGTYTAPVRWFVRADGAGRYTSVRQSYGFSDHDIGCNGQADVSYAAALAAAGGATTNLPCAFSDFRFLYDSQVDYGTLYWVMQGGDEAVVDNTQLWRVGYDTDGSNPSAEKWCYGLSSSAFGCSNPPIPAGGPNQHTRIHGRCVLNGNCNTTVAVGSASWQVPNYANLTQLYGGHAVGNVLNFAGAQYVDIDGFEITSHNGTCMVHGSPAYPAACSSGVPYSDYDSDGIDTDANMHDVLFQDLYIHGHTANGLHGPLGANITMNRMTIDFNGFAGWNMDDGHSTNDGPNASISAHYVTQVGNGCNEEYPIVHSQFPALSCYDLSSGGFGDSWSGQGTTMNFFICDHCIQAYNTKDGFVGPHTDLNSLTITNSASFGNMGQQWKWETVANSTTLVANTFTVGNCARMAEQIPGAPYNYNQATSSYGGAHLSDFCRASGDVFSYDSGPTSTVLFANNTVVAVSRVIFDMNCNTPNGCAGTPYQYRNNVFLGYYDNDPNYQTTYGNGELPTLYYFSDPTDAVSTSNNIEYGIRAGDTCGGSILCVSPGLVNQPSDTMTLETQLDPLAGTLTSGSPAIGAGVQLSGITTDFAGASYANPPSVGALERSSAVTLASLTPAISQSASVNAIMNVLQGISHAHGLGANFHP